MTIFWLSLTNHKEITDRGWQRASAPRLYWGLVVLVLASGVINHPGLVHLDLGLGVPHDPGAPVRWVAHPPAVHLRPLPPSDGVVVEVEVILAPVEAPLASGEDHHGVGHGDRHGYEGVGGVDAPGVGRTGGLAVTTGGQGPRHRMMGSRLVTLPTLGLGDDLLGDLNPAEIMRRLLGDFHQQKGSFAKWV